MDEPIVQKPLWTPTQFKQLSILGLLPWNREASYTKMLRGVSEDAYNQLMKTRIEVARILSISNEEYYKRLKREGRMQVPISAFSNDSVTFYLKWFLWDQGGLKPSNGNTFVATEDIVKYAMYTHGFWAMEKYPYIVARPTAIILQDAGVTDEDCIILLDIYEVEDGSIPENLPKHCKDVMLLRLYVLLNSNLLHERGKSKAKGKIMFVSDKDKLEKSVFFDVFLDEKGNDPHAWTQTSEYLEVLSDHYLSRILPTVSGAFTEERKHFLLVSGCDEHISCDYCPPHCPNADKLEYPYQSLYDCGKDTKVVHLKDCYWGTIVNVRPCILSIKNGGARAYRPLGENCMLEDAEGNPVDVEQLLLREDARGGFFHLDQLYYTREDTKKSTVSSGSYLCKQYGVRWDNNNSRRKTTFYTKDELEKVAFTPPFMTAIYPSEVDEEVITICFHGDEKQNKAGIDNGVWGKVVDVKKDEHGVKVKVLLENLKAGVRSPEPYKTPWLKAEKFLVIDEEKYRQQQIEVGVPTNRATYRFNVEHEASSNLDQLLSDRIAEVKAMFEMTEGLLTHRQENLKNQGQIRIKISRDFCNQRKEDYLHADYRNLLEQYVYTENVDTYKNPAIIMILECHRGRQNRLLTGNRESKKIGCGFRIRITYFSTDPGHIYAEKICGHTNHNPHIVNPGESLPERLQLVLDKLFQERDYPPKRAFMHLSMWGMKEHNLDEEEMEWLTMQACRNARRRFINSSRSEGLANDEDSCRALASNKSDSVLYFVDEPGNWQFAIMTPEQCTVLRVCCKMIFIDACHSLNRKGDVTLTMLVRDPYGNGFPVAYCLCSGGETAAIWSRFLKAVVEKSEINPQNITFMLDKSTACIAALKGLRYNFILCIFHVMQAWGRHLRSTNCPIKDKNHIFGVLKYVRKLSLIPDELAFDEEERKFRQYLHFVDPTDSLLKYYDQEWSPIDHTWSKHGRLDLRHMFSDTNNLLERFFRSMKRDYLNGQRAKRRDILILAFLNQANGYHFQNLKCNLRNSELSGTQRLQNKYEQGVLTCRQNAKAVEIVLETTTEVQIDLVLKMFSHDGTVHYTCMGDFSCTCDDNEDDICMHVESLLHGDEGQILLCNDHILETASMIKRAWKSDMPHIHRMQSGGQDSVEVELYECWPSSFYVKQEFPPKNPKRKRLPFYANKTDNICTCHCFRLLSICPHLIALEASSESNLREIMSEVRDKVSIRRCNKVNQEWVQMLQLQLDLTPNGHRNVPMPTMNDESQHLEQRKYNLAVITNQWKTFRRGFEKMSVESQSQYLQEVPPLVTNLKRYGDEPESSHTSKSRDFDPSERHFHTQLRFPRSTSGPGSANNSTHLGTQQLENLAAYVEDSGNYGSIDVDNIPSPGEVIVSPPPPPAGRHINAILHNFRSNLHDNELNE